jgi:hypothetical protein
MRSFRIQDGGLPDVPGESRAARLLKEVKRGGLQQFLHARQSLKTYRRVPVFQPFY